MRAAAVFALGTYILNVPENGGHSELAASIDHNITIRLLGLLTDGSPIVRQELASALHGLILLYEKQFQIAALRNTDVARAGVGNLSTSVTPTGWIHVSIEPREAETSFEAETKPNGNQLASPGSQQSHGSLHRELTKSLSPPAADFAVRSCGGSDDRLLDSLTRKNSSANSCSPSCSPSSSLGSASSKSFYTQVWKGMIFLASDPNPSVAHMAQHVVHSVHDKVGVIVLCIATFLLL